jgi:hypothetical protein
MPLDHTRTRTWRDSAIVRWHRNSEGSIRCSACSRARRLQHRCRSYTRTGRYSCLATALQRHKSGRHFRCTALRKAGRRLCTPRPCRQRDKPARSATGQGRRRSAEPALHTDRSPGNKRPSSCHWSRCTRREPPIPTDPRRNRPWASDHCRSWKWANTLPCTLLRYIRKDKASRPSKHQRRHRSGATTPNNAWFQARIPPRIPPGYRRMGRGPHHPKPPRRMLEGLTPGTASCRRRIGSHTLPTRKHPDRVVRPPTAPRHCNSPGRCPCNGRPRASRPHHIARPPRKHRDRVLPLARALLHRKTSVCFRHTAATRACTPLRIRHSCRHTRTASPLRRPDPARTPSQSIHCKAGPRGPSLCTRARGPGKIPGTSPVRCRKVANQHRTVVPPMCPCSDRNTGRASARGQHIPRARSRLPRSPPPLSSKRPTHMDSTNP